MAHFPDTYSARGADRLKATIVNYWLAQGYTNVRVERYQVWEGVWGIRSNLVNGMPPEGRGKYLRTEKRILTPRVSPPLVPQIGSTGEAVRPQGRVV